MVLLPCIFLSSLAAASIIDDSGSSSSPLLSRDSSSSSSNQLPVQVGGIVASYIIFDALVVCLLLLVGRRLRRAVQASNYTLEVVMIQPGKITASTDPSPISGDISFPSPVQPSSRGGWNMSWSSMAKHHKGGHASTNNSVTTVDESVVSADKRRAQEEMEFLYAAVMEHDARKAASSANSSPVLENEQQVTTFSPLGSPVESPLHSPHLFPPPRPEPQHQYQTPLSPRQGSTTTTTNKSRTSQRLSRISNLSIFSPSRLSSNSNKLKSPRSIRDLPISPPVRSPDVARTATFDNSAPLSPRMYTPGPPPLAPLTTASSSTPKPVPASFALQPISLQSTPRSNAPAPLSITSSNTMLPFRQQFNPPLSAPPTKTTILERPLHVPGGPRTGMPTPYSPYMPFTPVTPLTPSRFVTKREKRMKDKSNGLRVLHEDDMVKGDDEMWGT
ncbi:hypothetical protein BGW36DRAFT_374317 [Talaromyces proteolyticus]|uniref:Uncharacterized protein n=1 Tax=Talaromyces proteolyticus TaxID=1131652 RepID=A0AAD4PXX4_9EURO|nr:uncharacterized protein BGW36DRAFT_374317 [Talaromyces proteolyticus]KAH8700520.1 hypothetical protein BGW36DRAFT_374317 [Talaromyces proteolyticus]